METYLDEEVNKNEFFKGIDLNKIISLANKWYMQCSSTANDTENIVSYILVFVF